jgi:hypothetical protein
LECFAAKQQTSDNPTYTQAMKCSDWKKWKAAIETELSTLRELKCREIMTREDVPPGAQILPSKYHLKIKYDSKNQYIKHKARLVVLGNLAKKTIYSNYFSPTANSKSTKLLLSLAIKHKLVVTGLDVYGAFINSTIDEPVYISLPKDETGLEVIWLLRKTLYGLRNSPKKWYEHLSNTLLSHGYARSANDPCLFFKLQNDLKIIITFTSMI